MHQDGPIPLVFAIDNMRYGGTELNAVRTAERLDRRRFDLRVVCLDDRGPIADRYRSMGVPVIRMAVSSLHGPSMLSTGWQFARYLRKERVQIVHAHDMYSNVFATPWARAAGTPVVIASRRWWHTLPNRKLQLANAVAFRMAGAVLTNSAQVARSVREVEGVPEARVWTVTNFVDEEAFTPLPEDERARLRREWGVPAGAAVVGCVARLVPVKNHALLVEAFAELRRRNRAVHLVLIGDGECRDALTAQVRALGIEHAVAFVGELRSGGNHHRAFDVSALVSLSEGFPNTLIEAMAAGVPAVATAVGGSVDAVVDGVTGLLVPAERADALTAALQRLVDDSTLRESFGGAARDRAWATYRAGAVVQSLESMYDALLARAA
ncbi:MAG TPA: glycosyltransferase [Gemmatimonadaceae bacterium]